MKKINLREINSFKQQGLFHNRFVPNMILPRLLGRIALDRILNGRQDD